MSPKSDLNPSCHDISTIDLPTIDLSPEKMLDATSRREEMSKLMKSFTTVGFCLVTGLKQDGYDAEQLLRWTRWFFHDVSEQEKVEQLATKAFNAKNKNLYRGYFPVRHGGLSHKEGYDISKPKSEEVLQVGNPFMEATPKLRIKGKEKEVEEFYKVMYKHRAMLEKAGDTIFSLIAEAGGADYSHWTNLFGSNPLHTLRLIRYPQRKEQIPKAAYLPDGQIISTGAHQDSGLLTILQVFGSPGLELELDGTWYKVEAKPDTLVVNLGEQMTDMSNGLFKATIHRVVDIGRERFSMPFFYEPCCDGDINMKIPRPLLPESNKGKTKGKDDFYYPYASFLLNKLPIYTEYASICDDLPQGMLQHYLGLVAGRSTCWATKTGVSIDGDTTVSKLKKQGSIEAF